MLSKNYRDTILNAFPPISVLSSNPNGCILICVIQVLGGVMCFGGQFLQC